MTGPVTTDALVEKLARDLAREGGWNDPDAPWTENQVIIARGGVGEPVWRDFVGDARSLLGRETFTTLLAALQQVTAERDEARAENDRFRAGLANGSSPCAYCNLSREDWTKCRSGFPGCDRADDAMLCPHFGAEMEANDRADAATSELARLRAEGEAKDRALKDLRADANALGVRLGNTSQYDDPKALRDLCWEAGNFLARRIVRPALARAATAREGA